MWKNIGSGCWPTVLISLLVLWAVVFVWERWDKVSKATELKKTDPQPVLAIMNGLVLDDDNGMAYLPALIGNTTTSDTGIRSMISLLHKWQELFPEKRIVDRTEYHGGLLIFYEKVPLPAEATTK